MATTMNVGQTTPLSIQFLDQLGQPMNPTPTPDVPPSWAQTTPATESLTAAADGLTAAIVGLAAGTDTVNLTVLVGGVSFAATIDSTVTAVAPPRQTLTSVGIVTGTITP